MSRCCTYGITSRSAPPAIVRHCKDSVRFTRVLAPLQSTNLYSIRTSQRYCRWLSDTKPESAVQAMAKCLHVSTLNSCSAENSTVASSGVEPQERFIRRTRVATPQPRWASASAPPDRDGRGPHDTTAEDAGTEHASELAQAHPVQREQDIHWPSLMNPCSMQTLFHSVSACASDLTC